MIDKKISKYFSDISKKGHKQSPRPKEFYSKMGKKSAENKAKKLSTLDN